MDLCRLSKFLFCFSSSLFLTIAMSGFSGIVRLELWTGVYVTSAIRMGNSHSVVGSCDRPGVPYMDLLPC